MSGRWFRLYEELVDDPKVQRLPAETFKALINLWCLASRNDGELPSVADIGFSLRMPEPKVDRLISDLRAIGLFDEEDGATRPHNWNGRQFKSDVSTERVQRHRKRRGNVSSDVSETSSETPPETEQNRAETVSDASASSTAPPDEWSDDRQRLFGGALQWLRKQTGRKPEACRSVIARWLKLTGDDATALLGLIRQARDRDLAEPIAWIEAALRPKTNGHTTPVDWTEYAEIYRRLGRWPAFLGPAAAIPAEHRHLFPDLFTAATTAH